MVELFAQGACTANEHLLLDLEGNLLNFAFALAIVDSYECICRFPREEYVLLKADHHVGSALTATAPSPRDAA